MAVTLATSERLPNGHKDKITLDVIPVKNIHDRLGVNGVIKSLSSTLREWREQKYRIYVKVDSFQSPGIIGTLTDEPQNRKHFEVY